MACFDLPIELDLLLMGSLVPIMRSMVACSTQLGLSFVGVNWFATSDVSNCCGKYGKRRSTLNTRCRPRKGEYSIQKHLHPWPWWWFKDHSEVDEASYWVLWGTLLANATKPCCLLGICMEPNVDHGASCTWQWLDAKHRGFVVGWAEYFQWTC